MDSITLQNTNLTVSRLCIGGCPAGEYGWGNVSRAEVQHAMLQAVEHGVNFFDTADTYGLGRSEETLGETLRPHREKVVIATKFGVRVAGGKTWFDNSPAYIETALNESRRRLQTDYIDLYQVHYLDGVTPIDAMMEALIRHQQKGDIRAIGLSNITPDVLPSLTPYADYIATFQNHYSLAHREDEAAMRQMAHMLTAAPLTWGSLGQGILTGKYDETVHFDENDRRSRGVYENFHGDKLQKNLRIVAVMRPIAQAHHVPVASVAVRWILQAMQGSVVITGVKTPEQAKDNALALRFALTDDELAALTEVSA